MLCSFKTEKIKVMMLVNGYDKQCSNNKTAPVIEITIMIMKIIKE